jgi:hypothetical protein
VILLFVAIVIRSKEREKSINGGGFHDLETCSGGVENKTPTD